MITKYTHTSIGNFRQSIADNLGDGTMVFWTQTEIDSLIQESLLTFGAISGFWKREISVPLLITKQLYDLFVDTEVVTEPDVAPTLIFQKIIDWVNRDLGQAFDSSEILYLAATKYNQFQVKTNLVLSKAIFPVAALTSLINLGDNVLDVVRVKYIDNTSTEVPKRYSILGREDEANINHLDTEAITSTTIPAYYTNVFGVPNEITLYPAPFNAGELEVISVNAHALNVTTNTVINLPNNLVPYLKYGVLAEIYARDGIFSDAGKAAYCNSRWEEGIAIGQNYSIILTALSDGQFLQTDSLFDLDMFSDYRISSSAPSILGLAGLNIFGLDIIPDSNNYNIKFSANLNANLPGTHIDVASEYIDLIRDYATHLGQLKCGIAETQATMDARKAIITDGIAHNIRLKHKAKAFQVILGMSKQEEKEKPLVAKAE